MRIGIKRGQLSHETRPIKDNILQHKYLSTKKLYNIQIDDIQIIPTYKLIHMCFPNTTCDEIQYLEQAAVGGGG